tara:strand:- start:883 stop:1791 length:909 start_codon:yes stop_codon:yes gene_type:complete
MSESIFGGTYGQEVTSEVADSLITPTDNEQQQTEPVSTTDSEDATGEPVETQETEQPESSNETAPTEDSEPEIVEFNEIEIDGVTYTTEQLQSALQDSNNRSEWQKSNTQKAQEIAEREKLLKAEFDRINGVMKDEEVVESLKDILGDDHAFFKESPVKFSENVESQPEVAPTTPQSDDRVATLEAQVQEMQLKEEVTSEINNLVQAHPELKEDGNAIAEVLDIASDRNISDLEDAYLIAQARATEESAIMKAMKKLKEADELKSIPEVDTNKKGDHSPKVEKSPDFDHARNIGLRDYQLFK